MVVVVRRREAHSGGVRGTPNGEFRTRGNSGTRRVQSSATRRLWSSNTFAATTMSSGAAIPSADIQLLTLLHALTEELS